MSNAKLRRLVSEQMNVGFFDRNESPSPPRSGRFLRGSFWFHFHFQIWPRCFSNSPEKIAAAVQWMEHQKKWYESRGLNYPPEPLYSN